MNLILEPVILLKMSFFLGIFQGFYLNVSEDFFYRTAPCILVVIAYRLCMVFLR